MSEAAQPRSAKATRDIVTRAELAEIVREAISAANKIRPIAPQIHIASSMLTS